MFCILSECQWIWGVQGELLRGAAAAPRILRLKGLTMRSCLWQNLVFGFVVYDQQPLSQFGQGPDQGRILLAGGQQGQCMGDIAVLREVSFEAESGLNIPGIRRRMRMCPMLQESPPLCRRLWFRLAARPALPWW